MNASRKPPPGEINGGSMAADEAVSLAGSTVVITGAGRGLGAAYARDCAARGARLVITDISGEGVQALARELSSQTRVETRAGDVTDPAFVDELTADPGAWRRR